MMYGNYGVYGYGPGFEAFRVWHVVGNVIGIVFLLALIVWIGRRVAGRGGRHWRGCWGAHSGLTVLNERYARGEIEKEEYLERKKTLLGE